MYKNKISTLLFSFIVISLLYSCEKEFGFEIDGTDNSADNNLIEDGKDDSEIYNELDSVLKDVLTKVNFVYDYNMYREDLFNSQVGTTHLYVFDSDSVFLFDRSLSRCVMTGPEIDFSMSFDTTYIKPGHRYLLVAMAQGNHSGYEWSTVATPGFQIPIERQMIPHVSKLSDYRIVLDRDRDSYADIGVVDYRDAYGNTRELMDTLWSTKSNKQRNWIVDLSIPYVEYKPTVEVLPADTIRVKMEMMRITNSIKVNLVHDSFDETTDVNDYNILIDFPNGNGTIDYVGTTYPARELFYRALRKEVVQYQKKESGAQYTQTGSGTKSGTGANGEETHAIQASFGVSRLQVTDGSSLQVRDSDGNLILSIDDFAQWLADYFDSPYDDQEFLDREYDFTIDIKLSRDNVLEWYQMGCSVLGWGKRVYIYDPS